MLAEENENESEQLKAADKRREHLRGAHTRISASAVVFEQQKVNMPSGTQPTNPTNLRGRRRWEVSTLHMTFQAGVLRFEHALQLNEVVLVGSRCAERYHDLVRDAAISGALDVILRGDC